MRMQSDATSARRSTRALQLRERGSAGYGWRAAGADIEIGKWLLTSRALLHGDERARCREQAGDGQYTQRSHPR